MNADNSRLIDLSVGESHNLTRETFVGHDADLTYNEMIAAAVPGLTVLVAEANAHIAALAEDPLYNYRRHSITAQTSLFFRVSYARAVFAVRITRER